MRTIHLCPINQPWLLTLHDQTSRFQYAAVGPTASPVMLWHRLLWLQDMALCGLLGWTFSMVVNVSV